MTENTKKESKKPPDGGWGWFVCLGSSLITVNSSRVTISFYCVKVIYLRFNKNIVYKKINIITKKNLLLEIKMILYNAMIKSYS